ncbi:hypothetical protein INR49_016947 [Caranx melampygus]|nr:hypothetical protein INR49_016947 [Caranx melampygus]
MAEARREDGDEGERGDLRELRSRGQATDHPERTKSEYLHSRRPEITIVAAEPLAANNWFPGASVVFPPPQAGWSSGLQPVSQPPPSYDQVIQEKTQEEQTVKPTAAPRRPTCTTTCATQTDPVRDDTTTTTLPPLTHSPLRKDLMPPSLPLLFLLKQLPLHQTQNSVNAPFHFLVQNPENRQLQKRSKLRLWLSAENQWEEDGDIVDQLDEASQGDDVVGEMNAHGQRNIQARIQAFESQASTDEGGVAEPLKPRLPRKPSINPRANSIYEEEPSPLPPVPPVKSPKEPLKPNLNINNHNSASITSENEKKNTVSDATLLNLTMPLLLRTQIPNKVLPPRPPPAKTGPGRPPPPKLKTTGRSVSAPVPKPQAQKPHRKGLVLPPRPNPGHRLYNKYTLELPHGIAALDYNGSNTGELSFQKNEVLLLLEDIDRDTFECQAGDARGRVHKSHMKVITPLSPPQGARPSTSGHEQKVQVIHDFIPEGPGELDLRAGDIVTGVEKVDNEWYRGNFRGSSGFFPINFAKVLSDTPKTLPKRKPKPPSTVSGPRCMARFDFEGEHSDELSFSEGDVIHLKEYIGQEWARGQVGSSTGIFPLNFVEVIEDLPPPLSQTQMQTQPGKVALPGMVPESTKTKSLSFFSFCAHLFSTRKLAPQSKVAWVVALYDYAGKSEEDLSFQQGDCILITQRINDEWSCGRLNGREGMFPTAFVESSTGQQPQNSQQKEAVGGQRARALYNFTSDCDEELSLQVMGDIITNLESIDEEWFLGDLRGKRALVPKNYVQVL